MFNVAQYVAALSNDVEYLNSRDATIMGSRNGHAPIYMWFTLTRKGYEGMRKDVERCLRNALVLKVRLCEILQQSHTMETAALTSDATPLEPHARLHQGAAQATYAKQHGPEMSPKSPWQVLRLLMVTRGCPALMDLKTGPIFACWCSSAQSK